MCAKLIREKRLNQESFEFSFQNIYTVKEGEKNVFSKLENLLPKNIISPLNVLKCCDKNGAN